MIKSMAIAFLVLLAVCICCAIFICSWEDRYFDYFPDRRSDYSQVDQFCQKLASVTEIRPDLDRGIVTLRCYIALTKVFDDHQWKNNDAIASSLTEALGENIGPSFVAILKSSP